MLSEEIKKRMMAALKAGKVVEKEILRVVLGEVQTAEARDGALSDASVQAIVRRLIKSNEETLTVAPEDQKATLADEIAILRTLLPQTLDVPAIVAALASVHDAIRAAGNDGQATGVAMKALKTQGALVEGKDVASAVRQIRG
ncbi:MAG: GatB/YqeY domain-containing protein [Polyangiaceae bacterium]|nr:GatB/YqeY domain-containing protein [Polyangiaceae bacterium]